MISEFAKEKVFWSRKMNLNLVRFIESRPNIWNPKHPKYTSVAYRDKTYAEFASKYGNDFTGKAVKDRWTNIRSTFANYLRKLIASRSKIGEEEYKVNWHLWEACQFLHKVNRKVSRKTTSIAPVEEENDVNEKAPIQIEPMEPYEQVTQSASEEDFLSPSENESEHQNEHQCKNIADSLVTVFRGVQNDAFGIDDTKHGRVGRTIAKKLSQMNSYDAARAANKIMSVLLLYDILNPLNPNNLKSNFTV